MEINYSVWNSNPFNQVYGGEFWDGEDHHNDYSLQVEDCSISGIEGEVFAGLAVEMINHLIVNGYDFEIVEDSHQDVRYKLQRK